jgi:hypothetical protein
MAGMLRVFCLLLAVVAGLMASMTWGQVAASVAPQTVTDVLHQMSDEADVIFMGQVLAVRLPRADGAASGIVEIEFRVDEAILGCTAGEPYVLREWGGLWAGGTQRYRVGQRLLMLLRAPSGGGMSSPIGGLDGAIPIRQSADSVLVNHSTPPSLPFVDLRWLGARLPRAVSYLSEPVRTASTTSTLPKTFSAQKLGAQAVAAGAGAANVSIVLPLGYASAAGASIPAQQASVDVVLELLTTWQKAQHVTP